jgi:hypothetical protein
MFFPKSIEGFSNFLHAALAAPFAFAALAIAVRIATLAA